MPNTINLRLLDNKNIIAELNGIPLAQENSYKIIAGEVNATQFQIVSKPNKYANAEFTVAMVNSQGKGILRTDLSLKEGTDIEYIIENDKFTLPVGMAVSGYGNIQITAYLENERIPFMPLKLKVWNTLKNWEDYINSGNFYKFYELYMSSEPIAYFGEDYIYHISKDLIKDMQVGDKFLSLLSDPDTNEVKYLGLLKIDGINPIDEFDATLESFVELPQGSSNSGSGANLYTINDLFPKEFTPIPLNNYWNNGLLENAKVGDKILVPLGDEDENGIANEIKYLGLYEITIWDGEIKDAEFRSYIDLPSGSSIEVDEELSTESTNPVQNKVVAEALSNKVGFYDFNTKEAYQNGEMVELSNVPIFLRASKGIYLSTAPDGSGRKVLGVTFANNSQIENQSKDAMPFGTHQISLAVRAGLTAPKITWTDEEKALARENLGISGGGTQLYDCVFILTIDTENVYEIHMTSNQDLSSGVGSSYGKGILIVSGSGALSVSGFKYGGVTNGLVIGAFNDTIGSFYLCIVDENGNYSTVCIDDADLQLVAVNEL